MVAACASEPSESSSNADVCESSLEDYCSNAACNRTLAEAENDRRLCGPGYRVVKVSCGGYDMIVRAEIDSGVASYYRDRELVAYGHVGYETGCIAGPARFTTPVCYAPGELLRVCDAL